MDKPITVVYEDFKQEIADLINNSGLPAFIVEPILYNLLMETRNSVKKQYEYDKEMYLQSLQTNESMELVDAE